MKNFFRDKNLFIKVVAFATAFTVLYDFVKDLGEIFVHIYHFFAVIALPFVSLGHRRK